MDTGEVVADITGVYGGIDTEFVEIGDDSVVVIDNDGKEATSILSQVILDTVLPARAVRSRAGFPDGWEPYDILLRLMGRR